MIEVGRQVAWWNLKFVLVACSDDMSNISHLIKSQILFKSFVQMTLFILSWISQHLITWLATVQVWCYQSCNWPKKLEELKPFPWTSGQHNWTFEIHGTGQIWKDRIVRSIWTSDFGLMTRRWYRLITN